jgi:hypothetical protein
MSINFKITILVARLENLGLFERDMRMRLESRLREVHMLRKWDEHDQAWVWVLELNDDVQEGLGHGSARSRRQSSNREVRHAGDGYDGGAMEIDGQAW